MRTVIILTLALSVVAVMAIGAQGGDPVKGRATFVERKCDTCHKTTKTDTKGGKLATILGDTVGKLTADDIKNWLTDPAKQETKLPKKPPVPMSAFFKTLKPGLSPTEIANLIAYVQTLPLSK